MRTKEQAMTIGDVRVRRSFNPTANVQVETIKAHTAQLIDLCEQAKQNAAPEETRLWALAQTAYEEASMWAVKAATTERPTTERP
jgi:hypothetical protein